jgi:hypothetical protein
LTLQELEYVRDGLSELAPALRTEPPQRRMPGGG